MQNVHENPLYIAEVARITEIENDDNSTSDWKEIRLLALAGEFKLQMKDANNTLASIAEHPQNFLSGDEKHRWQGILEVYSTLFDEAMLCARNWQIASEHEQDW